MPSPLHFDEGTHSYFLAGIAIPSVTRCLDHAGLVSFDMVRREVLERKSIFGTYVHQACHYYDENALDWNSIDPAIRGRVEGWAKFRSDTGFVPRRIEQRFSATVNGMTYGLTVDREGIFAKSECIIDIKTSEDVAEWCAIQTAGYALGVPAFINLGHTPLTLFHSRRRMVVQLKDGDYKKYDFTDKRDVDIFLAALQVTLWKMGHKMPLRKIEE